MNPILVALDLDTADAALAMASKVRGQAGGLKVGWCARWSSAATASSST